MHDKYRSDSIRRIVLSIRRIINGFISFILRSASFKDTNIGRNSIDMKVCRAGYS